MTAQGGRRAPATGWLIGILVVAVVAVGAAVAIYRLRGDAEPELTIEERLELIEGRSLTAAEVSGLLDVGQALCDLDDAVLDEIWIRLDEDQLDFQDFVFAHLCPERSTLYAASTGRYVTEEAEKSGVTTSTSTAATSAPPSSRPSTSTATRPPSDGGPEPTGTTIAATSTSATTTTVGVTTTVGPGGSTVTLDPGL